MKWSPIWCLAARANGCSTFSEGASTGEGVVLTSLCLYARPQRQICTNVPLSGYWRSVSEKAMC